jgi:hypothetical protein
MGGLASIFFAISSINLLQFKGGYVFFAIQLLANSAILVGILSSGSMPMHYLGQASCIATGIALLSFIVALNRHSDFLDVSAYNYFEIGVLLVSVCTLQYLQDTFIVIGFAALVLYILIRFREFFSNQSLYLISKLLSRKIKN